MLLAGCGVFESFTVIAASAILSFTLCCRLPLSSPSLPHSHSLSRSCCKTSACRVDSQQDTTGARVTTNATFITADFTRKLNTLDPNDHVISTSAPMTVIWAINTREGIEGSVGGRMEIPEHRDYGSTAVHFGQRSSCSPTTAGNSFTSGNGRFSAQWTTTADGTAIDFVLTAQTTGWLAMGMSSSQPDWFCDGEGLQTVSSSKILHHFCFSFFVLPLPTRNPAISHLCKV